MLNFLKKTKLNLTFLFFLLYKEINNALTTLLIN
ncbi:hypothetical protein MNBD_BACTEROID07-585 [hydrothermal vent metagenome]|uniref:Uncharacterized protein n=1 Tax=hydrothermal vent metagenome TaxID=652676 RepID=A0A3B0UZ30_9ZZZZ